MLNFLAAIASAPAGGGGSFESLATASGTGSSNVITFSSIPTGFQHLEIRALTKISPNSNSNDVYRIRFNNDSGSNYAQHYIWGSGSVSVGGAASQTWINFSGFAACSGTSITNNHGVAIHSIHDYASTTKNKTVRNFWGSDNNTSGGDVGLSSGLWMSTAAINSISLISDSNWNTTTRFALYGIKGA